MGLRTNGTAVELIKPNSVHPEIVEACSAFFTVLLVKVDHAGHDPTVDGAQNGLLVKHAPAIDDYRLARHKIAVG